MTSRSASSSDASQRYSDVGEASTAILSGQMPTSSENLIATASVMASSEAQTTQRRGWPPSLQATHLPSRPDPVGSRSSRVTSLASLPRSSEYNRFDRPLQIQDPKWDERLLLSTKRHFLAYHAAWMKEINEGDKIVILHNEDEPELFNRTNPIEPLRLEDVMVSWEGIKEPQLAQNHIFSDEVYERFRADHQVPRAVHELEDPELKRECIAIYSQVREGLARNGVPPPLSQILSHGSGSEEGLEQNTETIHRKARGYARAKAHFFTDYASLKVEMTEEQKLLSECGKAYLEAHAELVNNYAKHGLPRSKVPSSTSDSQQSQCGTSEGFGADNTG